MYAFLNSILLAALCIIYPAIFVYDIARQGPTLRAGIAFGVSHLVLVPLLSCALTGTLLVDQEFRIATLIPDLDWTADASAISIMLLPVITLPFAFPFLPRGTATAPKTVPQLSEISWRWWLLAYVSVALASFILSGLSGGSAHWYRTREEFSRENGLVAVLLVYVQSGIQLLAIASLFHDVLEKKTSYKVLLVAAGIVSVVDLYTTGNRIWVLFMLACVVVTLLHRRMYGIIGVLALLLVPFGYMMTIFRWFRAYLHISSDKSLGGILTSLGRAYEFAQERLNVEGFGISSFVNGVTESIDVAVYHGSVVAYSGSRPLLWGGTFLKVFVFWVPRSVWADKPDGITVVAAQIFAPTVEDLSLVTTIFGEFYMNFGMWFVVVVPLGVVLVSKIAAALVRKVPFADFLMFIFGIAIIRFPVSDFLLTLIVAMLIYIGGNHFLRSLGARRASSSAQGAASAG